MNNLSHTKSSLQLKLTDNAGTPLKNVVMQARQTGSEFLFGCGGFTAVDYAGTKADGSTVSGAEKNELKNILDKIFSIHNYATLPFYWGRYEPTEGKPLEARLMAAAKYLGERGVAVKGHPLCWHTVCADWLLKYSNAEILKKQEERITREVSHFKGLIDRWDVINEVVIMPVFDKYDNAVTRLCKELGQIGIVKKVFEKAREANPGAALVLNDFNTSPDYENLIERCLDAGIKIDIIGIQSHQHQGYWGLEKLNDVLARFSRFGLPIHFTENTLISGDLMPAYIEDLNDWQVDNWPSTPAGEARQEKELLEMYETLFACPQVEAITTWNATDDAWLGAPAGLIRKDGSEKPAFTALRGKILGDWRTNISLKTDENGFCTLEGFRGDYEISLQDTQNRKAKVQLDKTSTSKAISL